MIAAIHPAECRGAFELWNVAWAPHALTSLPGGTVEVQNLTLGRQERGIGEYTLNVSSSNPDPYVPDLGSFDNTVVGNMGTGTFVHASGKHFIKNNLILGLEESGHGVYKMNTGSVLWTDTTIVGSKGSGVFTQNGGIHHIGVDFDDTVTNEESLLQIGLRGEYNLKDGVLKVGGRITIVMASSGPPLAGTRKFRKRLCAKSKNKPV